MEKNTILSRRELLARGFKIAAAVGMSSLVGSSLPETAFSQKQSADILTFDPQAVCELTCIQTIGPCYAANPIVRQDITAGRLGLPTRLGFRIVDTNCNPITNASVDIWHTDTDGVYSALTGFCANGSTTASSLNFLRGVQNTDSDGWAYFDTIFPGWYPSRTTHIHATIRIGTTAIVTSQFYFLDRVSEFVYRNHPLYTHRPNRATKNTTDNILGGSIPRMLPYIFSTKFLTNRPLKAWKTIVINTSPTVCNA